MRNKSAAAAAVVLAALPIFAHAAERKAPFSGGYMGLHAGVAWGSSDYGTDPGCAVASNGAFCDAGSGANGTAVASSGTGTLTSSGFTGGVQAGYNWRTGNVVLGAETDFGALNLSKATTVNGVFPIPFLGTTYALTESMSTQWVATVRARLGVAVAPQLLLYATGGVALTELEFASSYGDNAIGPMFPGGTGFGRKSSLRAGWALGAGGEWQLDNSWSIKAEYLYLDFGSQSIAIPVSNTPAFAQTVRLDADVAAQIARVGINYRY